MLESHLPTADLSFILSQLERCDKIIPESKLNLGSSLVTFVIEGDKPMHKRYIPITHDEGQVNFNQATGLAIRFHFMGNLLEWFQEHRKWKEGAYVLSPSSNDINEEASE